MIPLHWRPALLRALVRTQDLCQKPGTLPVHVLEPRAKVPLLLRLLLWCARLNVLLAAETREEALLCIVLLDSRETLRFRARLDLDFLLRQILRLQIRVGRLRAGLLQRRGGHVCKGGRGI